MKKLHLEIRVRVKNLQPPDLQVMCPKHLAMPLLVTLGVGVSGLSVTVEAVGRPSLGL